MTFDKFDVKTVLSAEKSRLVRLVVEAEVAIDKNKFISDEKTITKWLEDNVGKYCWYHPINQALVGDFDHDGGDWSMRYGNKLETDDNSKLYVWFAPSYRNEMMLFKLKWS